MAKQDLKLIATSQEGKKITTTMSHANPEASRNTLITFAQKLNELTTNTYEETDLVTTTILDTEDPTDTRPEPTLTFTLPDNRPIDLSKFNVLSDARRRYLILNYTGDGDLYAYTEQENLIVGISKVNPESGVAGLFLEAAHAWDGENQMPSGYVFSAFNIYVVAKETENYRGKTFTYAVQ